jgi:flagellar biosynthetic protein FliR
MHIEIPQATLVTLLLVSARCLAWMMIAPPMATGGVPRFIKVIFSVALALVIVPVAAPHAPQPELVPVVGSLLQQLLIGAGLGFLTRLLFAAVESAGNALDLFGGFALATAYDPMSRSATSIFGRFYALLCTVLIFATNTHLVIFGGFLRSFTALPLDAGLSLDNLDQALTHAATQLFVSALQIAGPLIIVLFIADISLGVLNRIAPQLNAFSMGFPVKIGLTLLLVGMGFAFMPRIVVGIASHANDLIATVTG